MAPLFLFALLSRLQVNLSQYMYHVRVLIYLFDKVHVKKHVKRLYNDNLYPSINPVFNININNLYC